MSKGGAKIDHEDRWFKQALLGRLRVLRAQPNEVLVLEMPHGFFEETDMVKVASVQQFAAAIASATGGRDVFLIPQGTLHTFTPPPRPLIEVPDSRIILPQGVRIDRA